MQDLLEMKHSLQNAYQQLYNLKRMVTQHAQTSEDRCSAVVTLCHKVQQRTSEATRNSTCRAAQAFTVLRAQTDTYSASCVSTVFRALFTQAQEKLELQRQVIESMTSTVRTHYEVHVNVQSTMQGYAIKVQARCSAANDVVAASMRCMHTHVTCQNTLQRVLLASVTSQQASGASTCAQNRNTSFEIARAVESCWHVCLQQAQQDSGERACVMASKACLQQYTASQRVLSTKCASAAAVSAATALKARRSCVQQVLVYKTAHRTVQNTFLKVQAAMQQKLAAQLAAQRAEELAQALNNEEPRPEGPRTAASASTFKKEAPKPENSMLKVYMKDPKASKIAKAGASRVSDAPVQLQRPTITKRDAAMEQVAAAFQHTIASDAEGAQESTSRVAKPSRTSERPKTSHAKVQAHTASPVDPPPVDRRRLQRQSIHKAILQDQAYLDEVQTLEKQADQIRSRLGNMESLFQARASTAGPSQNRARRRSQAIRSLVADSMLVQRLQQEQGQGDQQEQSQHGQQQQAAVTGSRRVRIIAWEDDNDHPSASQTGAQDGSRQGATSLMLRQHLQED